ncbi:MarR family winged helix-turn-helix transcriptional regulator [Heyndrickxia acidicola]|uniref:MarR family transcriptional regulator n=1 Tax=Heyndrickxia acidicola TaxID=209389 RepID=A0ABU6MA05_9BACI|nr:MarR family transcriptional regulator [Heyndrickxia acidicola]MED1201514.1 MarR family transcriptional regulator [Heyndrickxia acidicola]
MKEDSIQSIEYEIALLVRLITAYSPRLGMLDRSEYMLLSVLENTSPLSINGLAEHLMLNLSTASRQIAALESKKYIKRSPDIKNGRISLVEITSGGLEILHKVQKARSEFYSEVLQDWSQDELESLEANLTRLNFDFRKWGK